MIANSTNKTAGAVRETISADVHNVNNPTDHKDTGGEGVKNAGTYLPDIKTVDSEKAEEYAKNERQRLALVAF